MFRICIFLLKSCPATGVGGHAKRSQLQTAKGRLDLQTIYVLQRWHSPSRRTCHHLLCEISCRWHPRQLDRKEQKYWLVHGKIFRRIWRLFVRWVQLQRQREGPEEPCSYEMWSNVKSLVWCFCDVFLIWIFLWHLILCLRLLFAIICRT